MCNLSYPANVQFVMSILFRMLNAEVIDPDWSTALMYNFDFDINYVEYAIDQNHPMLLSKSIYDVGFETYNPILNLGGLYIFYLLVIVQLGVLGLIYIVVRAIRNY